MWKHSQNELHAWIAGLFESGGSIGANRVSIQTPDKELAGDLERTFGGSTAIRRTATITTPGDLTGKTSYLWSIERPADINRFIQTVLPYLHPRRAGEVRTTLNEIYEKERRHGNR